jgi:hypothetical protein
VRGGLFRSQFWRLVGVGDGARVNLADAHRLALGCDEKRRETVREGNLDLPTARVRRCIAPLKERSRHVGRKERAIQRVIDGDLRRLVLCFHTEDAPARKKAAREKNARCQGCNDVPVHPENSRQIRLPLPRLRVSILPDAFSLACFALEAGQSHLDLKS